MKTINRKTLYAICVCSLSAITFLLSGCVFRDYWPTNGWRTAAPEDHGMDPEKLKVAEQFAENMTNAWSVLVVKDGYIVSENYYKNGGQNKAYEIASATKSVTSTLVGIAIDKGFIESAEQPICELMPEYFSDDADDWRNEITLKDSLTMTWGYDWPGDYDLGNPDHPIYEWMVAEDRFEYALTREQGTIPGDNFIYDSSSSHFLSGVIADNTGMSTLEFANKYLFGPLGIKKENGESVAWKTDNQGYQEGGFGLELTPRQMAKIGFLLLNEGFWEYQQVVSKDWVENATKAQVDASLPGTPEGLVKYGYQWWTNAEGTSYHALGYGGQMILVIPEVDMVIVLTSVSTAPEVFDPNNTLMRNNDMGTIIALIMQSVIQPSAQSADS